MDAKSRHLAKLGELGLRSKTGTLLAPENGLGAEANVGGQMGVNRMTVDPDTGIPDLIHRLGDDSKRLVSDEVHLAKLEMSESVRRAGRGAVRLGIAFGVAVVALVAFTLLFATLIGRLVAGHMWVGALVTGVGELALALYLINRGKVAFKEPSYTFEETREGLKALR